jgi:hypothetical protein
VHQGAVRRDVFLLGREEDVGGVDAGERGPQCDRFQQVGCDGSNAGDAALRLAGDAVDLSAPGDKMLGQIAPDQAGRSGDDCTQSHRFLLD